MMPYQNYEIAKARVRQAQDQAARHRMRLAARDRAGTVYPVGVMNAVGHGLIAIGSRLVSDPVEPPNHRRAA